MNSEDERRTPFSLPKVFRERLAVDPKYIALLAIVILAAFLRFWNLGAFPPGLQHDEAYNGLDALALLNREVFPIFHEGWELYANEVHSDAPIFETTVPLFFEGNYGREPLNVYLTAVSINLFGATPFAVRLPAALFGIIAVIAVYLAASALLVSPTKHGDVGLRESKDILKGILPLIAAFIVAVNYSAVTYSRYGVRVISFVAISSFTVYCFWRGVRKVETLRLSEKGNKPTSNGNSLGIFAPKWFIVAGILMGLGFYAYAAARFLPLLFVAYGIYWFIRDRRAFRRQWANLLVMFIATLLVILPLIIYLFRHPYFLIYRSRVIANRGTGTFPGEPWKTWSLNVGRVLLGLFWRGDQSILRNNPGRTLLDPIQLLFVLIGLAEIVLQRFRRRDVFLILWFGVMLIPSILSGDAPHFGRLIGIIPPIAIIMAKGVGWIGQILIERIKDTRYDYPQLIMASLMLLLIISGGLTVFDYFWRYANISELESEFDYPDWELGQYVAQLPEESTVYLVPTQEEMATVYFAMSGDKERLRSFYSPAESLLPYGHVGVPAYYVIRPDFEESLLHITEQLKNVQLVESIPSFFALSRPASSIIDDASASDTFTWGGAITLNDWMFEEQGDELVVTLNWQSNVEMSRSYTAYVHLLAEDGSLVSQLDRLPDGYPTTDWRPGEFVRDEYRLKIPTDLSAEKYFVQTGFYYLPTGERLGEPEVIGQVNLER